MQSVDEIIQFYIVFESSVVFFDKTLFFTVRDFIYFKFFYDVT